jgi:hypothetical protein
MKMSLFLKMWKTPIQSVRILQHWRKCNSVTGGVDDLPVDDQDRHNNQCRDG